MKISLITAVYNRERTIGDAIASVKNCGRNDLEYLVIDGDSTDGTQQVVEQAGETVHAYVREPDGGIYDALNKGIERSSGDVIGFLHADDLLADSEALDSIADLFESGDFDAVYADLTYVDAMNPQRVVRYWKSGSYNVQKFRSGWMPPHPTVYIRRSVYDRFGGYRTDLGSAADYECMVRLMVKHQIRVGYLPRVTVKMRVGGESNASIKNRLKANQADCAAWAANGLRAPLGLRFSKPLRKLPQYWRRP